MKSKNQSYEEKLRTTVARQVHSKRVGFLLGAGCSHLNGRGYPLATQLFAQIKPQLHADDAEALAAEIEASGSGLEAALDSLDRRQVADSAMRMRIAAAIRERFRSVKAPLDAHRDFVRGLSRRQERRIALFTLNYDPMLEAAGDEEGCLMATGFEGSNRGFFHPDNFRYNFCLPDSYHGRTVHRPRLGVVSVYALHGSAGWFRDESGRIRRIGHYEILPENAVLLMIPPHHRKNSDTARQPYSALWSEFRSLLTSDRSRILNRMVCVGYGMQDEHVNDLLDAALARPNFTLIILAKELPNAVIECWGARKNVMIATERRSALYGDFGVGVEALWSFEWLAQEVNRHAG